MKNDSDKQKVNSNTVNMSFDSNTISYLTPMTSGTTITSDSCNLDTKKTCECETILSEKLAFIEENSHKVIVITGPSGIGKSIVIDLLEEEYHAVQPTFITTRELRDGEAEEGHISVSKKEFLKKEYLGELFIPVSAYGNLYGYFIDEIIEHLAADKIVVVEAPPSRIVSEVATLLPNCITLAMMPSDDNFTRESLAKRNSESSTIRNIRQLEGMADLAHTHWSLGFARVFPIVVIYGEIEHMRSQIRTVFTHKIGGHKILNFLP